MPSPDLRHWLRTRPRAIGWWPLAPLLLTLAGSAAAQEGDIVDDARRWAPDTERYSRELVDRAIQQAPGAVRKLFGLPPGAEPAVPPQSAQPRPRPRSAAPPAAVTDDAPPAEPAPAGKSAAKPPGNQSAERRSRQGKRSGSRSDGPSAASRVAPPAASAPVQSPVPPATSTAEPAAAGTAMSASPGAAPAVAGAAALGAGSAAAGGLVAPPGEAQPIDPAVAPVPQPAPPVQAPSPPAADPLPERIPPGAALVRLVDDQYATRTDLEGEVRVIDAASGKSLRKLTLRRGTLVLPADLLKGERVLRVLAILRDKSELVLIEGPAAQIDSRYLTPDAVRPLAPVAPSPAVAGAALAAADPSLPECADRDPLAPLSASGKGPQAAAPPCLRTVPGPACRLALAQRRVGETEAALRALKSDPASTGADRPLDRAQLCASPRPPSPTELGPAAPGPLADLDRALTEAAACVNAVGTWLADLRCERPDCASPRDRQIEQAQLRALPDLNLRALNARERLERVRVQAQDLERRYAQHRKYCGNGGG